MTDTSSLTAAMGKRPARGSLFPLVGRGDRPIAGSSGFREARQMRTGIEQANEPRLAFSTLACPDWSLERVVEAAGQYGYGGVELRLIDGETIAPGLSAGERRRVRTLLSGAGVPIVAVDTSIRLAGADPGQAASDLRWFLDL